MTRPSRKIRTDPALGRADHGPGPWWPHRVECPAETASSGRIGHGVQPDMKPGLFRTGRGIVAAALGVFLGGCVAIQDILVQATSGGRDDVPTTNGDDGDSGDNGEPAEVVPVVSLSVSNPTPQVNEDVILTCTADGGNNGLTFDFQPAIGRLFVNDRTGIATFTVDESDVGQAFSFTCTGTNDQGTSEPSNEQMILATPL